MCTRPNCSRTITPRWSGAGPRLHALAGPGRDRRASQVIGSRRRAPVAGDSGQDADRVGRDRPGRHDLHHMLEQAGRRRHLQGTYSLPPTGHMVRQHFLEPGHGAAARQFRLKYGRCEASRPPIGAGLRAFAPVLRSLSIQATGRGGDLNNKSHMMSNCRSVGARGWDSPRATRPFDTLPGALGLRSVSNGATEHARMVGLRRSGQLRGSKIAARLLRVLL